MGNVTWIVPHGFAHSVVDDVDYRVMSSFLDFYQTMFKFVVFKLYKDSNMKYPPFGDIDYDLTTLSLTKLRTKSFSFRRKINCNKSKQKRNETEQNGAKNAKNSSSESDKNLNPKV